MANLSSCERHCMDPRTLKSLLSISMGKKNLCWLMSMMVKSRKMLIAQLSGFRPASKPWVTKGRADGGVQPQELLETSWWLESRNNQSFPEEYIIMLEESHFQTSRHTTRQWPSTQSGTGTETEKSMAQNKNNRKKPWHMQSFSLPQGNWRYFVQGKSVFYSINAVRKIG